jgi:RNase H-like domain found in reverse transcriptase/Integrase zinc binding domain
MESICGNGQPFYWKPLHETCLSHIKDLVRKTPILRAVDVRVNEPIWVVSDASGYGVGALYGQGPDWRNCRPAGFMSKKFTSAQRSYRTFEHEALAIIEALMKWEHKSTIHYRDGSETIKTTNRDGKSGQLIHWDKYLSRFKYEVMHVPGEQNKVADCLSRYYENDRYDEVHEHHQYVSADVRLNPNSEDLTELHLQELGEERLHDQNKDHVVEAETMANAARLMDIPEDINPQDDIHDMTVGEALQNGPSLQKIVLGDKTFLQAVKDGYEGDSTLSKVIANPGHYPLFRVADGIIHTKNRLGDKCMCIPRSLLKGKCSLPEIVIDHVHDAIGHLGPQKTSEYTRRWFWWPRMG